LLARQRLPVWLRCVVDGDDVANSFHPTRRRSDR
jgi:hypothetical protein